LRPPEVRKYLFDIAEACSLVSRFTAGKSFEDYTSDPLLRSAVERQFEIAGEALSRLLQLAPDLISRITDARRIVAFVTGSSTGTRRLRTKWSGAWSRRTWGFCSEKSPLC
jgi:uncharacterized protein with HEPN domain